LLFPKLCEGGMETFRFASNNFINLILRL